MGTAESPRKLPPSTVPKYSASAQTMQASSQPLSHPDGGHGVDHWDSKHALPACCLCVTVHSVLHLQIFTFISIRLRTAQ